MNCQHIHLRERVVNLEDLGEVVNDLMGMLQGPAALLSKTSCRVNTDRELLATVLALREVLDILKVSKGPCQKLFWSVYRTCLWTTKHTYVLMTGVLSKTTNVRPSAPGRLLFSGMLLRAVKPDGISISKSKAALRFGSSKQGSALRASQDSNCVLNMRLCCPSMGTVDGAGTADLYFDL